MNIKERFRSRNLNEVRIVEKKFEEALEGLTFSIRNITEDEYSKSLSKYRVLDGLNITNLDISAMDTDGNKLHTADIVALGIVSINDTQENAEIPTIKLNDDNWLTEEGFSGPIDLILAYFQPMERTILYNGILEHSGLLKRDLLVNALDIKK